MKPKVSIIVPVYNAEKYIGRCIESVKKQALSEWELIIVDDCSSDCSYDIVKEYASKDKRIKAIRQEENHGPMVARRVGDLLSSGEFITYCDSDDTFPPIALQKLYEVAMTTGADIVSGNALRLYIDGTRRMRCNKLSYGGDAHGVLKSLLEGEYSHVLWSKLIKAELLKNYEYTIKDKMTNGEDSYFFYQVLMNTKDVVHIPDIVYNYYVVPNSSTQKRLSDNAIDNIFVMNAYRVSLIKNFPDLKKRIVRYVSNVYVGLMISGYNKKFLKKLASQHGIENYCSFVKYVTLDFPNSVYSIIKRYLKYYKKRVVMYR